MRQVKFFLAFGFGCLTAMALGFGPRVMGGLKEPGAVAASTPVNLEGRLKALEEHAADLEQRANSGPIGSKVVAPFQVTDGKRRIFYVGPDSVNVSFGNKERAWMSADSEGGNFFASSASGNLEARLGRQQRGDAWGISVSEAFKDRIVLGRNTKGGNHHLSFFSSADQQIAGIGESSDTHAAVALVFDKSGNLRARMAVSTDGKGIVDVFGINKVPIAQLTESESGGGRLWIGNAGGVGMVEAGDAGGYGIVRAGPKGFEFIPTPGLALPGSVIVGKR